MISLKQTSTEAVKTREMDLRDAQPWETYSTWKIYSAHPGIDLNTQKQT
jgi:hypothetical protein